MAAPQGRARNKLKMIILQYLLDHGSSTIYEVATGLGVERHNVANACLRLKRSYLVTRMKVPGWHNRNVWTLEITQKGLDRLAYYKDLELET